MILGMVVVFEPPVIGAEVGFLSAEKSCNHLAT